MFGIDESGDSLVPTLPRSRAVTALAAVLLCTAGFATAAAAPPANPLRGAAAREAARHAAAAHQRVRPNGANPNATPAEGGGETDGDSLEVADQADQFAYPRSAPALSVSAAALQAARRSAARLPQARGRTSEVTTQPLNAEPAGYTDPTWSNAGAGFRNVSGRITALAADGSTLYAGAADGGVWRSRNGGRTWTAIWDHQDTLSIGALLVGPDHSLWVGTGESNTNSDSYLGTGVYRSTDGGRSFRRVGGGELTDRQTFRLRDDGAGHVYAATSKGLWRHADNTSSNAWHLVLKPDPNPTNSPYDTSFITDVVARPGTHGKVVLAALGWRNGTSYNGFYLSNQYGASGTFHKITPSGDIDTTDIGRTTFAYAADGSKLYAIVQSPKQLLAGADTVLQGVFASKNGNPDGPYTKIADSDSLGNDGSALKNLDGYHVGIQAWYNQFLAVDPHNANHVYLGLEEVFETTDGGATFTAASPYWNYGLACGDYCPPVTHPDQHAVTLTSSGQVVIGNDGGVYSRPTSVHGDGHWSDLNDTLRTLQYYDAASSGGRTPTYWGGLQDNGTSVLLPHARQNIEPAGGDGGMVLVDPNNGNRAVGEYTDLAMYSTTDGGHTFRTVSPECGYYANTAACDPSARFIAPFEADVHNTNHWVAAGNKVWTTSKGWNTQCATTCDWTPVHSFGTDAAGGYNVGTAVAENGATIYAGWVDSSGNPSPSFRSGIDTNYGGTWHRISSPVLPNRFVAGLTVDPANPAHVYAIYNGYSRRWIPGGGQGTIFESHNGGRTWKNISGNLPDAPGDGAALVGRYLVLATDVGLFVSDCRHPGHWRRLGRLPNSVVDNIRTIPGTHAVLAATHGRGMWRVELP